MTTRSIVPTQTDIQQAQQAIDRFIQEIANNPDRRDGAYPYALFHPPGEPIFGTVLMFHGFSAKPHQMWRLADYLFKNGFNVYQATLAGHACIYPAKNWPQVDLRPEIAEPLKAKIQADPVLQNYLQNLTNAQNGKRPSYLQQLALMARLLKIEPRLLDIMQAIETNNDPDFDRYYISSHMNYLLEAQKYLQQLASIPGPLYTVGLSVGGATALALAADQPNRIQKIVAYAPLLKVYGEDRRKYVNLAGPLDIQELGWDPNLKFPVGALTAADRFGNAFVLQRDNVKTLAQVPTFLVLTENEDAADIKTNQDFFQAIGKESNGHRYHFYPASDLVPHPMVDPTEVSQNMSNRFWQSLYQETFRFLTTGEIDSANLSSIDQNPDLPPVSPI